MARSTEALRKRIEMRKSAGGATLVALLKSKLIIWIYPLNEEC